MYVLRISGLTKKFKINEVNVSDEWDPNATTLDTIKGINFSCCRPLCYNALIQILYFIYF